MTRKLPLIRLSTANPFLLELRGRHIDAAAILRQAALPEDIPASGELFVSSTAIYALIEECAEVANDPCFGYGAGSAVALLDWGLLTKATVERPRGESC